MVRAGCVFVAGIHPSGSFESMRWNACMHAQTRPRFILSSEGVFGGTEFEPKGSTENVPRGGSNPRRCGQRAQALPTELFRPPFWSLKSIPITSDRKMAGFVFWKFKIKSVSYADKGWKANFPRNEFNQSTVSCAHLTSPTCTAGVVGCGIGY